MNSDALVVAVALAVAACATLVGLAFATWIAGRHTSPEPPPSTPIAALPPSVADGVAPKHLRVLAEEPVSYTHLTLPTTPY